VIATAPLRPNRMWAAVAFSDIVGSTRIAARLGDDAWRQLLDSHDAVVREACVRFDGRVWKWTGDGALMTFPSPRQALRSAKAMQSGAARLGLTLRIGVNVGEVDVRCHDQGGADICGLVVNITSRLTSAAAPGRVLLSRDAAAMLTGEGCSYPAFTGQQTSVVCASRSSGSPVGR